MELRDIKDVLTFAAFRPEPDNSNAPWAKRFAGKRCLLINISRDRVTWRAVNKKGQFDDSGSDEGEFPEVVARNAEAWRSLTENGWVTVSINMRFMITMERNLSRKRGYRSTIRTSPKSIIGAKYDRGKIYGIHQSPETNASLLLASDESLIKAIEETLKANGLQAARICCGLFTMTSNVVDEIHKKSELKKVDDLIVLTACEGSICALRQRQGQWAELRCRSGLDMEDPGQAMQILGPFVQGAGSGTRVVFMNDEKESAFSRALMDRLSGVMVVDVTGDDQLWISMSSN